MKSYPDSYVLFPEAQALAAKLIVELEEFSALDLAQVRIVCIRSARTVMLHGKQAAAVIARNSVQAPQPVKKHWATLVSTQAGLEDDPEFLVYFDGSYWDGLDAIRRERLVYHELCHLEQKRDEDDQLRFDRDGRPVLALVPHDYEFFHREVTRYGPSVCGLEDAAIGIAEGHRAWQARQALEDQRGRRAA